MVRRGVAAFRVAGELKKRRHDRGWTLRDTAEALAGIGWPIIASGVSKMEEGRRRVDVDDLLAFATVFGVSPHDLLGWRPQDVDLRVAEPVLGSGERVAVRFTRCLPTPRGSEPIEVIGEFDLPGVPSEGDSVAWDGGQQDGTVVCVIWDLREGDVVADVRIV